MVNQQIREVMYRRGISQTILCNDMGISLPNFNAFLKGKRSYPYKRLVQIMEYLNVKVARDGCTGGAFAPKDMRYYMFGIIKAEKMRLKALSEEAGVNPSVISSFINGKRKPSARTVGKIMEALDMTLVDCNAET